MLENHAMDWAKIIGQIEDILFPKLELNVYERTVYYHMLRHTRLVGKDAGNFGLAALGGATGMSDTTVREAVRSMDSKGCIKIEERGRQGHLIRVMLPSDLPNIQPTGTREPLDLETLDFFTGRRYLTALVLREDERCFYCRRRVTPESCVLDHVNPQVGGVDNSYRNVVVTCHECNSAKQGRNGEDFVRELYRRGVLSVSECQDRVEAINAVRAGKLVPKL